MKGKNILFSVIIPTYNNAHFLKSAVDSVLAQTYKNFEILIIDNNSTDETSKIIANFDDSRISEYKISNNGVIAKSRNMGISLAKGNWICFLDSDDIWYKSRLEIISQKILTNLNCDVFTTNEYVRFINSGNKKRLFYGPLIRNKYKSLLLYGNRLSTSATVVKKEFLDKFGIFFNEKKSYITVEDYDFWLQLALKKAGFKFIKSFQGEYLIHNNNSSGKIELHRFNLNNLLKDHVYNVQDFSRQKNKLWLNIYSSREFIYLIRNKNKINSNFIKNIVHIFFRAPFFIINYLIARILYAILNEIQYILLIKK